MKRLLCAVVMAVLAVGIATVAPSSAEPRDSELELSMCLSYDSERVVPSCATSLGISISSPRVEGRGYFTGQLGIDGRLIVEYGCAALTTGTVAASTSVTCKLKSNGIVINQVSMAAPGNAVATVPTAVLGVNTPVQVCWEASAVLTSTATISDWTEPNCTSSILPLAGA